MPALNLGDSDRNRIEKMTVNSYSQNRDSDSINRERLLERILDIGELMLQSGAEINRVEDTLCRLGRAYGAVPDVYVIVFSIAVTLRFPDGATVTQTRRVGDNDNIDFEKLDRLNDLSRRCCSSPMTVSAIEREIDRIRQRTNPVWILILGNALGAFSFSVFFGGSVLDGLAAALFSLLIVLLQCTLGKYSTNRILYTMVVSAIVGLGIGGFCRVVPHFSRPMIMIGDIMLLNPGITMINAVREMMVGNTISGEIRLIESFTWALALAAGFMLAIHMTA